MDELRDNAQFLACQLAYLLEGMIKTRPPIDENLTPERRQAIEEFVKYAKSFWGSQLQEQGRSINAFFESEPDRNETRAKEAERRVAELESQIKEQRDKIDEFLDQCPHIANATYDIWCTSLDHISKLEAENQRLQTRTPEQAISALFTELDAAGARLGDVVQFKARTEDRIAELEQWVADLQSGMYVNCVYCGHRYGPYEKANESPANILTAHIEQCPKHPLAAAKARIAELEQEIISLKALTDGTL